jgi:hypothetical protein
MKFLHFAENSLFDGTVHNKKLFKILPVLDHLRKQFASVYTLDQSFCVDESLIPWKGCLSWKPYSPSKRIRFGIKVYKLCEGSLRYVWNFTLYTGKDTAQ